MLRFLRIIVQNGSVFLFVILQCLCLFWVVKHNDNQQKIYLYSSQLFASRIQHQFQRWNSYLHLRQVADSLSQENATLLAHTLNVKKNKTSMQSFDPTHKDSALLKFPYSIIPAVVINNSLERRNNMLTLNVGGAEGVSPGMGVITSKGVVGIITDTSRHFSIVMSLLNQKMKLSAKLVRSGFFGTLTWDGENPQSMDLEAIQKYADVRSGDAIVTSGYSIVFPEGILVGYVDYHKIEGGSFTYTIKVTPSQSLTNLNTVYVINHPMKEEKQLLESKYEKDE